MFSCHLYLLTLSSFRTINSSSIPPSSMLRVRSERAKANTKAKIFFDVWIFFFDLFRLFFDLFYVRFRSVWTGFNAESHFLSTHATTRKVSGRWSIALKCESCTAELEFESPNWVQAKATSNCRIGGGQPPLTRRSEVAFFAYHTAIRGGLRLNSVQELKLYLV